MRGIVIREYGGPEVLALEELPSPTPGPGQLLVDVSAAGINYRDVYERAGRIPTELPLVAGVEGAGTVAETGEGVTGFARGDRVCWWTAQGSYAEQVVVETRQAVPVPDDSSDELAAAVILQGLTAHYLVTSARPIESGDAVLVHAVAGGVGLLVTQLVKERGGRVIGTASTEEKAAIARAAGADEVIGYDGFAERARELTGGSGVAVVYDGIGRATFDGSLAALRPRGTVILFGMASGPPEPMDVFRLFGDSLYLTMTSLGTYTATREELLSRAADVFAWLREGRLDVRLTTYPLGQAAQAHEELEGRRTTGKLVLVPQ